MLALLVVAAAQILPLASGERPTLSYDPYATSQAAVKLLALTLFLALFAAYVNTDARRELAARVIVGVCVLIALVGIGQTYIGKALWQRGSFGPFVNRNHFAGFLEMGAGLTAGLLAGRVARRELAVLYACAALVLCAGVVLSASRGGLLALMAAVAFLALAAWPASARRERRRLQGLIRAGATATLGVAALAGAMFLVGSEGLVQNLAQLQTGDPTVALENERFSRREIWGATIRLIEDHPLAGVGLGAFPYAYTRYDPSAGAQRVEQSHNDYLQILADAGLIGGAIALLFIVLLFVRGFLAVQTRDRRQRAVTLGALTGCFAIAVHSFVDFNLQVTANAQLFLALAALATPARSEEDHPEQTRVRRRRATRQPESHEE